RIVEKLEQLVPFLRRDLLAEVRGVVGGEKPNPGPPLVRREREEELRLVARAQPEEEILGVGAIEGPETLDPVRGDEQVPRILEVLDREELGGFGFRAWRRHPDLRGQRITRSGLRTRPPIVVDGFPARQPLQCRRPAAGHPRPAPRACMPRVQGRTGGLATMSARHRPSMLIVDDDPSTSGLLREIFHHEGYDVSVADRAEDAIRLARARAFDIVLSDVRMPDLDGIELLRRLRPILPDTAVVLITAFATVEAAIRALQEGAFDYVQKPFAVEEVRRTVERAMERRRQRPAAGADASPVATLPGSAADSPAEMPRSIIGKSAAMVELFKIVSRVAGSKASVLIEGER